MDAINDIDACVEQPSSEHDHDPTHSTTTDLLLHGSTSSQLARQHDRQGLAALGLATGLGATSGENTNTNITTTTAHLLNNPRMSYSGTSQWDGGVSV